MPTSCTAGGGLRLKVLVCHAGERKGVRCGVGVCAGAAGLRRHPNRAAPWRHDDDDHLADGGK
ncbi:MAG: hypothetical protein H0V78_01885 [Burkholderiales bacterium]|nr:hypothetical protein [Burkholderiales bacterium]